MSVLSLGQNAKHVDFCSLTDDSVHIVHSGQLFVLAIHEFWLDKHLTVRVDCLLHGCEAR